MFSLNICAHVLQGTVCVASRARRPAVPTRLLGSIFAALAARSRRPVWIGAAEAAMEHVEAARYSDNQGMFSTVGASMKRNVCTA